MVSTLLLRGMLVGLLAGLLLFAFGRVFGEPLIERAISFEAAHAGSSAGTDHMQPAPAQPAVRGEPAQHMHGTVAHGLATQEASIPGPGNTPEELVSRPMQAGLGLFTGVIIYATALGGLFALGFAATHQRAVSLSPRATSALLAGAGFVSLYLIPTLKYPASPPAIGEAETIGYRTALFFAMVACSLIAMIIAVSVRKKLADRYGGWIAAYGAIGIYLLIVCAAGALLPTVDEVPDAFPAAVLWQFRIAAMGMQFLMWTMFGLVFGALTERAWQRGRVHRPAPDFLTAT